MKGRGSIILLLLILGLNLPGQEVVRQGMIGLSKEEVIQRVKTEFREFRKDDSVVKQSFNYLKYVNRQRTKTWIIFFNEKDICEISKLVCDYSDFDETLEALDSANKKKSKLKWEYSQGSEEIQIEIEKKDWYYSIKEFSE